MSWQKRRGRQHLYKSIKVGDRYMSLYLGSGAEARESEEFIARAEAAQRRSRRGGSAPGRLSKGGER